MGRYKQYVVYGSLGRCQPNPEIATIKLWSTRPESRDETQVVKAVECTQLTDENRDEISRLEAQNFDLLRGNFESVLPRPLLDVPESPMNDRTFSTHSSKSGTIKLTCR